MAYSGLSLRPSGCSFGRVSFAVTFTSAMGQTYFISLFRRRDLRAALACLMGPIGGHLHDRAATLQAIPTRCVMDAGCLTDRVFGVTPFVVLWCDCRVGRGPVWAMGLAVPKLDRRTLSSIALRDGSGMMVQAECRLPWSAGSRPRAGKALSCRRWVCKGGFRRSWTRCILRSRLLAVCPNLLAVLDGCGGPCW